MHTIPIEINDSLLHVERRFRPIKAKQYAQTLKEQIYSKRTKDQLALKCPGENTSEGFVEFIFLQNLHEEGKI